MAVEPGLYTEVVTDNTEFDRRMQRSKKIADQMGYGLEGLGRMGIRAARQVNQTSNAFEANRRAAANAQRTLVTLENTYLDIGNAASRTARRVTENTRGFRLLRGQMYNASIQAQDFAVQVGAGTSAMVAFSQNAPQFLSVLGPQFAALGAIIAALPLLAVGYKALTGSVGDFTTELKKSNTAVDAYRDSLEKLIPNFSTRLDTFTAQLGASREALKDLAMLAERAAMRSIRDLSQSFADVSTEAGVFQKMMLDTDRTVVGNLLNIDTMLRGNITRWHEAHDAVDEFIELVRAIPQAETLDGMLEAALAARDAFKDNVDVTQELTADQDAFLQQISKLIVALEQMGAVAAVETGADQATKDMADLIFYTRQYADSRIEGNRLAQEAAIKAAQAELAANIAASRRYGKSRIAADQAKRAQEESFAAGIAASKEYAQSRIAGEFLARRAAAETFAKTIAASKEAALTQLANDRLVQQERRAAEEETTRKAIAASREAAMSRIAANNIVERELASFNERVQQTAVLFGATISEAAALQKALDEGKVTANELLSLQWASALTPAVQAAREMRKEFDISFRLAAALSGAITRTEDPEIYDPRSPAYDPRAAARARARERMASGELYRGIIGGSDAAGVGGGGGANPLMTQIEQLRESLLTQEQLELESYQRRRQLLEDFLLARPEQLEKYNSMMEALEQQHADRMTQIDAYRYGDTLAKTGAFLGDMAEIMANGNEKMLRISKAFGAAQALISTYQGAAKELEKGVFGFATAAALIAKGLGFVSAIQGVNKGGTTSGGGAGGVAAPAAAQPAPVSRNVAISLTGGDMFSRDQVRSLINSINEAVEDGAIVRLV